MSDSESHVRTVCSHDCPDACSVLVTIRDGRAIRFEGDPDHPITRGFLCGKVGAYEETINSPDRLLHPLRRDGAKGSGSFRPISWDEALDTIANEFSAARREHGGESILNYYYAGTMGTVNRNAPDAVFHWLGATEIRPNICYYGADAGYEAVLGGGYGVDLEDVVHSDFITVWGANIATTQVHLVPFVNEARDAGAPLWVIDVYRNRTAKMADRWLRVRPGTDTALALSLMHVLERSDRVDRGFIAEWTVGYERLAAEILPKYSPERVAAITGIDAETIEAFAHRLADAKTPLFKVGIGLGRSSHGASAMRAICCLAGALGAVRKVGGGVLYDSGCEFKLNLDPVRRPDWRAESVREMNMTDLGIALTEWNDPPIRALYVHGTNPATTAPLQARVHAGLERDDLFTVVHERFLTDTARFADIVLPAVAFPEVDDLYKSYGSLYTQYAQAAIPPPGEARSNLAVAQALAEKLGIEDAWTRMRTEEFVRAMFAATSHSNFDGIDVDDVLAGRTTRLSIPRGRSGYEDGFPTPSGKLEFYAKQLESEGHALVDYRGDPFDERPDEFPLRLITPPAHAFLNSSFGWGERARRREGVEPCCVVHPADADGARSGDWIELSNEHGTARLRAQVTEEAQRGVVIAEGTWWPSHSPCGRGINTLASARLTELGGGSTFHDNRVALRRVGSAAS